MITVAVNGTPRTGTGKKATKADRNSGVVPCVIYGGNEAKHFTTGVKAVRGLIYTADFKVAELNIDGSTHRAIVKNVQFHPVTEAIQHIDFLELVEGKPVKVELPVEFIGTSPGVKSGGKLLQNMRRVKVKALPEKLVDVLTLDISEMELGQSIRVRDIKPVEGIEVMVTGATPVAIVEIPRALRSATTAAEGEAGAEDAAAE